MADNRKNEYPDPNAAPVSTPTPSEDAPVTGDVTDTAEDNLLAESDVYDLDSDLGETLIPLEGEIEDEAYDVIGEDDDNPYEESDEALPDDREERALDRDNSKERPRFDEV